MSVHNHPFAPALLALTHIMTDDDPATIEALEVEDIRNKLADVVHGLEEICDVSYRA